MGIFKRIVFEILRFVLAFVFIYAGVQKLYNPSEFYETILMYDIVKNYYAYCIAYVLPAFEILLGAFLYVKQFTNLSAKLICFLIAVFIIAVLSLWFRGMDISCGCFGSNENKGEYLGLILRDIFIATSAIVIVRLNKTINIYKDTKYESPIFKDVSKKELNLK